jgi:hypothetical protein
MSEEEKKPGPRQPSFQLQLDEEMAQGRYVNFAVVNHNPTEFVLDFAYMQPQQPRGKVQARVILSPVHAKRFLMALSENVGRYEERFGPIKLPAGKPTDPVVH